MNLNLKFPLPLDRRDQVQYRIRPRMPLLAESTNSGNDLFPWNKGNSKSFPCKQRAEKFPASKMQEKIQVPIKFIHRIKFKPRIKSKPRIKFKPRLENFRRRPRYRRFFLVQRMFNVSPVWNWSKKILCELRNPRRQANWWDFLTIVQNWFFVWFFRNQKNEIFILFSFKMKSGIFSFFFLHSGNFYDPVWHFFSSGTKTGTDLKKFFRVFVNFFHFWTFHFVEFDFWRLEILFLLLLSLE